MSNAAINIGLAYPISRAKIELRAIRCSGCYASVMGTTNVLNSCQTVIRKINDHAIYFITQYATVMKGKYSSITVISAPKAFRNSPDTASISEEAMLEIQVMIPSKIQSKIVVHLLSDPELLYITQYTARRRSTAAGMLR